MTGSFIQDVLFVLFLAVLLGEVFEQLGLPSVAGELLSGVILGPMVLNWVTLSAEMSAISQLSLFFIVFLLGFNLRTKVMREHFKQGFVLTIASFIIPLILVVFLISFILPGEFVGNFVTALAITIPSISIISVLVMRFKLMDQQAGNLIVASVVITDVIGFVLLATVTQDIFNDLLVIIKLGAFFGIFALVDWLLNRHPEGFQRILERMAQFFKREELSYAILIIFGLIVSLLLELIGISYVLGGFFTGLIIHDGLIGKEAYGRISRTFTRLNQGFFIPLFFGIAGLDAALPIGDIGIILALIILILVAVFIPALLTYYSLRYWLKVECLGISAKKTSLILGGRGAVGIAIITLGFDATLVNQTQYSLVIFATIFISLLILLFLRRNTNKNDVSLESGQCL